MKDLLYRRITLVEPKYRQPMTVISREEIPSVMSDLRKGAETADINKKYGIDKCAVRSIRQKMNPGYK